MSWTFTPQRGVPGHCDCAQVWDENGKSLAIIEPTADEADATKVAAMMAGAPDVILQAKAAALVISELLLELGLERRESPVLVALMAAIKRAEAR